MSYKVNDIIDLRLKFNKAFNLPFSNTPVSIEHNRAKLQFDMMQEELNEYAEAENIVDVADALIDMQEILFGMFAEHGMLHLWAEMYKEVHDSNMSKLGSNGKPMINGEDGNFDKTRPLGKVLKSKNFVEPNFKRILNNNK